MRIRIEKRFLLVPTSEEAEVKTLLLYRTDNLVYDTKIRIDTITPTLTVAVNLSAFVGEELELSSLPYAEFPLEWSDKLPEAPKHPYRPKAHFTAPYGWLNDPNGLVEYTDADGNKTYHMFYQHNPHGTLWSNMTWGHATSPDMLHWTHHEPTLYPDELGAMYSGSAVVDKRNVSGLKSSECDPILLFYTAAAGIRGEGGLLAEGKKYTQCMAYSTDGGKSFKKYEKNPIIDHVLSRNRDPKVIWCEEISKYILAIYLEGPVFKLFKSDNLIDWEPLTEYFIDGDRECPDVFPFKPDGEVQKWVFTAANGKYSIYEFKDGVPVEIQRPRPFNYSDCYYAAQTFSDVADGRRIQIGWERYTRRVSEPFNGQMSIPNELNLVKDNSGYSLILAPISELSKYESVSAELTSPTLPLSLPIEPSAYDVRLTLCGGGNVNIALFGATVSVDLDSRTLSAPAGKMPLPISDSTELRMIFDSDTVEIYTDGGKRFLASRAHADYNIKVLSISGNACVEYLTVNKIEL